MIEGHETYLDQEDAQWLSKLGFEWGCSRNSRYFPEDGFEDCSIGVWAPRVSLARTWLYNMHNTLVTIEPGIHDLNEENVQYTFRYVIYWNDMTYFNSRYEYNHPDEALEAGVKKCIKLLAERNAQPTQER